MMLFSVILESAKLVRLAHSEMAVMVPFFAISSTQSALLQICHSVGFSASLRFAIHTGKSVQESIVASFFDYQWKESLASLRRSPIFFDIMSLYCTLPNSNVSFFSKPNWQYFIEQILDSILPHERAKGNSPTI